MEERNVSNAKFILIFIVLLIIGTFLWARFVSTKGLKVKEYPVYNPNVSENFEGLKIVHFSDVLYGRTVNKKDIKNIVKKINELNPDIVVFTGNLIDKDTVVNKSLKKYLTDNLSQIEARLYKFAIYGSYDGKISDYEIMMKNAGFTFLDNSSQLVYYNGNIPIFVAGINVKNPDYENALAYLKEEHDESFFKIILAHEPDAYNDFKSYKPDLVLSGHSLNGQVRIPFVGAIKNKKGSQKYYDEQYTFKDTQMYISGGIGTTEYSFRWFNKPSINLYRLYKK